jgi:glucose-fructose oxidoreductase
MTSPRQPAGPVRYAVVGAGWFAQEAVLPAFRNATVSRLAAIVSGDPTKRAELAKRYDVPAVPYSEFERVLSGGEVDAVYVATPNTEHEEPTLAAARYGVHVLCEKPLAESAAAAGRMVAACDVAGVRLMTAYRLHFEKANLTAVEHVRRGKLGTPRLISTTYTQTVVEGNVRLDPARGGHPLLDLGVYCVNAARYLFRDDPIEVTGYEVGRKGAKDGRVPDLVGAVLKFPADRLAVLACGFAQAKVSHCRIVGTGGELELNPAFSYTGKKTLSLTIDDDTRKTMFPSTDQVAPEIEYFSTCLLEGRAPEPDGWEGLADLRVIDAIRTSARDGRAVPVQPGPEKPWPDLRQHREKPPVETPELVHAAPPTD